MLSSDIGSVNESWVSEVMSPPAWWSTTLPGSASWGTVMRISSAAITLMSVTSPDPGIEIEVIWSIPEPRKRSSPPRATGRGPQTLRFTPPLYWLVSYSSLPHDVSTAGSMTASPSAIAPVSFNILFISFFLRFLVLGLEFRV